MEEKLRDELYSKLEKEYNNFIKELMKLSKEEILSRAYEKITKYDIMTMFYPTNKEFDVSDIKVLNKVKNPLEELYHRWMDFDVVRDNSLCDNVKDTINFFREEQRKIKNKDNER